MCRTSMISFLKPLPFSKTRFWLLFLLVLSSQFPLQADAQSETDVQLADYYSRKYPDEEVICLSSYRYFTFEPGKNILGDKVVEVQEESEYEFMSIKRFASLIYPEFYNKFIQVKDFKRSVLQGKKYVTSERGGYDRSVTGDNIFFDDSRVQFFPLRFTGKGVRQKVSVKKIYSDGKYFTRLYIPSSYPVKEQVFEFRVPSWLTVDFKKINFENCKAEISENKKGDYTTYIFKIKDLEAYTTEYLRIGRAFTDPHIIIQIGAYEIKGEKFSGFTNTGDVYKWNYRLYQMAGNEKDKISSQVAKIIQDKKTDLEKIRAIYYWVQDNIRYIAFEDGYSGYIPASAQEVLAKKYGDCKGMANLLTEMLKQQGFDASFAWVGTRHIPYPQSMPALCVNNHAICVLNYSGKTYFLDGTESYVPFGENAFRIQGKEVMVAKGDKYEIMTVPVTDIAENKIYTKADFTLTDAKLTGKVKVELTGNQRTMFHQAYQDLPTKEKQKFLNDFLEFNNSNLQASNIKTSNLADREAKVVIEGDVDFSNTVAAINNEKYAAIDFFPKTLERFIPDEKRKEGYDLDISAKFTDEISLTIQPDKKFIDKPENLELKSDGYEFRGIYTIENNKLTLKKELQLKKSIIPKGEFPEWTKFIESIRDFNRYLVSITAR